jgi:NAD(P)-dependent dehydrogenase (short-subunit alcohol dehydrogenase family)
MRLEGFSSGHNWGAEQWGGSIINTASFVAPVGVATPQRAYAASEGGVPALTRELAVSHARENIRANAPGPGGFGGSTQLGAA